MLKFKNVGILINWNLKIICSYDKLRARKFGARRRSLRARYAHAYERALKFLRPGQRGSFLSYILRIKICQRGWSW